MAESIRSFVSIHVPEIIREQIAVYQSNFRRLDADVRWVHPDNLHITLKFLGDISAEQVDPAGRLIADVLVSEKPFDLRIGHAGYFPNSRNPGIVWLGIDSETPVLSRIADGLNRRLEGLGFPAETRAFKSHLTIGRVKSAKNSDRLVHYTENNRFESDTFTVVEICLMRSMLKPSGAEYSRIQQYQL